MRQLIALALTALLALMPLTTASAYTESGSHAWSRETLVLYSGPGTIYDVTGEIPGEAEIRVLRCQKLWCNVDGPGGRGWTTGSIDFGQDPHWPLFDPDRVDRDLTVGSMCFFTGTNYTGQSFCAQTGDVYADLALAGWDNVISSIQVTGTSAAICRDRSFQSYCERIAESQPVLDRYLLKNLSSIRVY
jgi:hypothetical protein